MKTRDVDDLSNLSMLELFQAEAESQTAAMTSGLLELERDPSAIRHLEALMRAAHSLKGAARIVNVEVAVSIAHAMEDCFVAAQRATIQLRQGEIDVLFQGVDLLLHLSKRSEKEAAEWEAQHAERIKNLLTELTQITLGRVRPKPDAAQAGGMEPRLQDVDASGQLVPTNLGPPASESGSGDAATAAVAKRGRGSDRVLRLTAENLNRLLGLAGESLLESRWLHPFSQSIQRLKRMQSDLAESVEALRDSLGPRELPDRVQHQLNEVTVRLAESRQWVSDRAADLEMFDRRSANRAHRLYEEVLQCRMRPFADVVRRFPRMVRDLARTLGKSVRLEVIGEGTLVDRDILDKLETPLVHLLRNAVDHGCETAEERRQCGKPEEGLIRLEARHTAGMLTITVTDDGPGISPDKLRDTIVQKRLVNEVVAGKLSESELLEFLLLPGFTLRETVTEFSGRGVGLDVVHNVIKGVRGSVRIATHPGRGMRFQLHLPLTLSVLRTLLVEVAGEPYAIPLSQIVRALKLPREEIQALDGRHFLDYDGQQIGLLTAHQVLDHEQPPPTSGPLAVVVLGNRTTRYGLVVDRLLGERELVVQPLDLRLGKIQDISAGSIMEDGSPVLIADVEDMIRTIEKLISVGQLDTVSREAIEASTRKIKRILAVDDSLTVRELEKKLLDGSGYVTEVAVDGMDAWNAVRTGNYDLVITDVDLPRMEGIELNDQAGPAFEGTAGVDCFIQGPERGSRART